MTKTHLNNGNDNKINIGVPPHSCFNDFNDIKFCKGEQYVIWISQV